MSSFSKYTRLVDFSIKNRFLSKPSLTFCSQRSFTKFNYRLLIANSSKLKHSEEAVRCFSNGIEFKIDSGKEKSFFSNKNKNVFAWLSAFGLAFYGLVTLSYCEEEVEKEHKENYGSRIEGLPNFSTEEVQKHGRNAEKIWVTFKNGVYDITEFVEGHPGGDKILMASGGPIEPFWNIYKVHYTKDTFEMLESMRIGNLIQDESKKSEVKDAYGNEPKRHPLLKVLTQKPFNAESPKELSVENLVTPNELHFVRNHLPVPEIEPSTYSLEIVDQTTGRKFSFSLDDLKNKFPNYTIPVTLQCSGNKRKLMNEYEPVQGLMWDVNAISTAQWTGVKLRDVLQHCGVDFSNEQIKHVQFEGLDKDPTGTFYAASVPKEKVFNETGDVLLAFKMNGKELPKDFGFPVRAVIPGVIGARSVKWLGKVVLSSEESDSHWQKNDYKILPPFVKNLKEADFSKLKAMQESPVQSAICVPANGATINREDNEKLTIKGYAFSGGGKNIDKVMVSIDGGQNWFLAQLKQFDSPPNRSWAWSIWELEVDLPKEKNNLEIVCTAIDSAQNIQPESFKTVWNARGLSNNVWHRINVNLN